MFQTYYLQKMLFDTTEIRAESPSLKPCEIVTGQIVRAYGVLFKFYRLGEGIFRSLSYSN